MKDTLLITAEEMAKELGISKPHAYTIIREMNKELKSKGYIVISGKTSRQFFKEKFYGVDKGDICE